MQHSCGVDAVNHRRHRVLGRTQQELLPHHRYHRGGPSLSSVCAQLPILATTTGPACFSSHQVPSHNQSGLGCRSETGLASQFSSAATHASAFHTQRQRPCHRPPSATAVTSHSAEKNMQPDASNGSHLMESPLSSTIEESQPTWFEQLSDTQRFVLADEWGFSHVGTNLPSGVLPAVLRKALPEEVQQPSITKALKGLLLPLSAIALGYAWLWYMHSIVPLWQQLLCWATIGTGYMGLFQIAHECARGTFLPGNQAAQGLLGSLLMAPSLFSLAAWRVCAFCHVNSVNELGVDLYGWHPITVKDVAAASPNKRKWLRFIHTTPVKLLSSIGGWIKTMQSWDLYNYYYELREDVLKSWAVPAAFLGLALPLLCIQAGGLAGIFTYWLCPWLVFHAWLSTLTMIQHRAPHIPWHDSGSYDHSRAAVSGTVTSPMWSWLEQLLNYANYPLPQYVSFNLVPFYHAKQATEALREKLWPYMHEAPLTLKLLTNHITKWQVYDEERQTYITFDEAEQMIDSQQQDTQDNNGNGSQASMAAA